MVNSNIKASNVAPLLARVSPISQGAGSVSTAWVSMADVAHVLATVMVGVLGTNATVDAKIEQAKDGSGTSAKDLTGKAITQLTKAGSDDNKEVEINVRADELDTANAYTHVRLTITVGTAASLVAGTVRGFGARYQPQADAASVDEVI